jgi:hypothetical protein
LPKAHNHNIIGVEDRDRKAIQQYLSDGVFYVKIQGNLPLSDEMKRRLSLNTPESIDVALAQGTLTADGRHPIPLAERVLLPQGQYPGHTLETLRDHLHYRIDAEADLERKWPLFISRRPEFVKVVLLFSEEFEKRRSLAEYDGQKGTDPRLLGRIVAKARASGLRLTAHVATATDFHHAVTAGVDEIAHVPAVGATRIAAEDAQRAASQRAVVISTYRVAVPSLIRAGVVHEADVRAAVAANLRVLRDNGVAIAVGSDNPSDTSVGEVNALRMLGLFDNLAALKMWVETTPRKDRARRRIGSLEIQRFRVCDADPAVSKRRTRRSVIKRNPRFSRPMPYMC